MHTILGWFRYYHFSQLLKKNTKPLSLDQMLSGLNMFVKSLFRHYLQFLCTLFAKL